MATITWETSHLQQIGEVPHQNIRRFSLNWEDFFRYDEKVPAQVEKRIYPRASSWAEDPIRKSHTILLDKEGIQNQAFTYRPQTKEDMRYAIEVVVQESFKDWDEKFSPA